MTTLRRRFKKWLYESCPGFRGAFPYYGTNVYFPRGSLIYALACDQGIYESENQYLLLSTLESGATVIDVGANIGLMSIPLLAANPTVRVISIEPSPTTFSHLERTIAASPWRDRWTARAVATGDQNGTVDFYCAAPSHGAFDGIRDTHRGGETKRISVPLMTIDSIWHDAGRPKVTALKIDVEGAEYASISGARDCVRTHSPLILTEWNSVNIQAFGCPHDRLLTVADTLGYEVFAVPTMVPVDSATQLKAVMTFTESFALLPRP